MQSMRLYLAADQKLSSHFFKTYSKTKIDHDSKNTATAPELRFDIFENDCFNSTYLYSFEFYILSIYITAFYAIR